MTRFYKKGPLGMVKAEAGMSDPDVSEVRMSIKEYRELLDSVRSAQKSVVSIQNAANDRIARIKENAREKIEDARRQAETDAEKKAVAAQADARRIGQEVDSLRKQLAEAKTDAKNEKGLNENLIRIMRERSNQARSLKPKKQHDGYLVLESRQWKEKYKVDVWDTADHMMRYGGNPGLARKKGYLRTIQKEAPVWKSILQTPYDTGIPLDQVRYRVEEVDLFEKEILRGIGCTGMSEGYENNSFDQSENILYRSVFKANYRSRLWELEIYTTNELTVPEYRLPPQLAKPQKTRKTKEKDRKQPVPEIIGMENTRGKEEVLEEDDDIFDDIFDGI
ncbi:MAG: hypothetical protein U0L10_15745 [Lachnospiraceae bacterium]|nr:hypothetical protein [Lachnospiraceae bacterium]